jgi:hypothetical protein
MCVCQLMCSSRSCRGPDPEWEQVLGGSARTATSIRLISRQITNGPDAHTLVVYAKTSPEKKSKGITTFLIEKGAPASRSHTQCTMTPVQA